MNLHKLIFTESDCYKEGMAKKQFIKPIAPMWHSTAAIKGTLDETGFWVAYKAKMKEE